MRTKCLICNMEVYRDVYKNMKCNEFYGVDTSSEDESVVGAFELPVLKTLYEAYIEKGKSSVLDALERAESIEATHI